MASTAPARAFQADPYDYGEVRRLAEELALAEPVAVTLVRRGYRTVDAARRFLEAREQHEPSEFAGIEEVCELILSVARGQGRITIHGDYDVDGVCSTAILVSTLRMLGAECDWLIPDRLSDGYGLTMRSLEQLRRRGTELVVTVDCGIGSVEEVAAAQAAGIQVVVTDHHLPGERLPDCPIVHPVVSGYPFEGLCAAGVAHKLAVALCDAAGRGPVETVSGRRHPCDRDLDLVALATVADMVPLVGENRRLVREGLRVLRDAPRVGLRALMAAAAVDPESVDAGALGFRLGPRINAAGRLYRADAGVELMLTDDPERAAAIAAELDRANGERRWAEQKVVDAAERARSALPPSLAEAPALVLAGEGWHPGVVGIAASRLVERHLRPTILLSVDGLRAKGSARSIPGFDLVAALGDCEEHLVRYGGHRAAAGLELEAARLDAFREAFIRHAASRIDPAKLVRMERLDALVGVGREGIGMDLARQLESLGPFGMGNPGPRLLVPSGRLREVRDLGEEGKHSRFQLESGAGRALGVAFGMNGEIARREDQSLDLSVELEVDRWNGAEQPRVIVREVYPLETPGERDGEPGRCGEGCPAPDVEWWDRLENERGRLSEGRPGALLDVRASPDAVRRKFVDRRGGAAVASLAELISSGEPVLAICADATRRAKLASSAADPRRFGAALPRSACCRCGAGGLDRALREAPTAGLVLADWTAVALRPDGPRDFRHVVVIDPPQSEALEGIAWAGPPGRGYLHLAWGAPELELTERLLAREWELRGAIGGIWRALGEAGGEAEGESLRSVLEGSARYPRTAEVAARCVSVLEELGLCEWRADRGARALRVLSSERTDLARSRAYAACIARHQEAIRFLQSRARLT
jgi:single-stranded-DNA-specific exonuclease